MTATLSKAAFEKACAFLQSDGRGLDRALLEYRLGRGSADAAVTELAAYQNPDGGFGHGLEPDLATPASSAIATSVGLRLLYGLGPEANHTIVEAALGWLERNFDWDAGVWPIITQAVDQAPHAPWWAWSEDLAETCNGFRFNPSAELLGYLCTWRERVSPELLAAAEERMRHTLTETSLIEGAYDLKCAARLAEAAGLPADLRAPLASLVIRSVLAHDPADEHLAVLELATTPKSLLAGPLAERIEAAADALIATQQDDGGWAPFWDWSFVDADAWAKAKRDWRGWLTRDAIETLMAWDRVDLIQVG